MPNNAEINMSIDSRAQLIAVVIIGHSSRVAINGDRSSDSTAIIF